MRMVSKYNVSAPVDELLGFIIDVIICHIRILVSPVSVNDNDVRLLLSLFDHTANEVRVVHIDNDRAVIGRQLIICHLHKTEKSHFDPVFLNVPEIKKIIVTVIKSGARNILFIPVFARHIGSVDTHVEHVIISHIGDIKTRIDQGVSHLCRSVKMRIAGRGSECCGKRCLLIYSRQIRR